MEKEIIEKSLVPISEVRRILEERQKEGELKYIQRITLDHAQHFAKISPERSYALIATLKTEFNLDNNLATQIVNLMPRYLDEIRVFFTSQKIGAIARTDDDLILILQTLMEFAFSPLLEEQEELSETKVIKVLQQKPRSLKDVLSSLSLRGKGKEERAKSIFRGYLQVRLLANLVVKHALLPNRAAEIVTTMPLTLKDAQNHFGKNRPEPQKLMAIVNELRIHHQSSILTTDFDIPLSISQVVAETNPSSVDDLKNGLGASGEALTKAQLNKMLKAIGFAE